MFISRTNFELIKMSERLMGMDAQRTYSAAHFNGAIYDLQHELALEINKVYDLKTRNFAFKLKMNNSYGKYADSDSLTQLHVYTPPVVSFINPESYCIMQVKTDNTLNSTREPVTSDMSIGEAIKECNFLNKKYASHCEHYEIEVF